MAVAFWVKPDGAVTAYVDRSFPPVEDLVLRLHHANPDLRLVSDAEWDIN